MNCSLNALPFGIYANCHFARYGPGPGVIYFFMLNSAEYEIHPAHKC